MSTTHTPQPSTTTYTVDHVIGYHMHNPYAEYVPVIDTRTVTLDELADWLGHIDLADWLVATGSLGDHDEWMVR